jgi:hypothetical protein
MTAWHEGNRHPKLGGFLHKRHVLLCAISAPESNSGKDLGSISTPRHSHMPRRKPSHFCSAQPEANALDVTITAALRNQIQSPVDESELDN